MSPRVARPKSIRWWRCGTNEVRTTCGGGATDPLTFAVITLLLTTVFALAALLLASAGVYGVISFFVTQRTREIGLRVALGARSTDVIRLIVGQGMRITALGIVAGLLGAFALTRLMSNLLYGVSTSDPITFAAVAGLMICCRFTRLLLAGAARNESRPVSRAEVRVTLLQFIPGLEGPG